MITMQMRLKKKKKINTNEYNLIMKDRKNTEEIDMKTEKAGHKGRQKKGRKKERMPKEEKIKK